MSTAVNVSNLIMTTVIVSDESLPREEHTDRQKHTHTDRQIDTGLGYVNFFKVLNQKDI